MLWRHTFIRLNEGHEVILNRKWLNGSQCDKIPPPHRRSLEKNKPEYHRLSGKNKKHHVCTYIWQIFLAFFSRRRWWWFCCHFSLTAFEKKREKMHYFTPPGCCRSESYMKWTQRTDLHHLITVRWKASVNWKKKKTTGWQVSKSVYVLARAFTSIYMKSKYNCISARMAFRLEVRAQRCQRIWLCFSRQTRNTVGCWFSIYPDKQVESVANS